MIAAIMIFVFVFYLYFDLNKPEESALEEESRTTSREEPGLSQVSRENSWRELSTRLDMLEQKLTLLVEQSANGSSKS